jgi:hypothetical protein
MPLSLLRNITTMTSWSMIVVSMLVGTSSHAFSLGVGMKSSRSMHLWAKPKVFIDGEAGTTGIQVYERLEKRDDIQVISAPQELRKDADTRKQLINEADAVILCTFCGSDIRLVFCWLLHIM